jgi:hypothetical protein
MLSAILGGVLDGVWRGIGLLLVSGLAYAAYRLSFVSFRNTESYGPDQRQQRLVEAFRVALTSAAIAAVVLTAIGGYARSRDCQPDFANGEVGCSTRLHRPAQDVASTLVTALMLLVGPVVAARIEYRAPPPAASERPAA